MVSNTPSSTRPGWVRQVNGVGSGVSIGGDGVDVLIGLGVEVGGIAVGVGKGWLDGEQADNPVRSESHKIVRVIA